MANLIVVGISDMNIAPYPDNLITYALGSCVGICLYDERLRLAGLSHILLPEKSSSSADNQIMKYAETAVPELVQRMERRGALRTRLTAKIAGGASMFGATGIGDRNVAAVKNMLRVLGIRLTREDTGADYGRTVEFHSEDGLVLIKSIRHGVKTI